MEGLDSIEATEDLYALWTRDFAPAQYCSVYVLDADIPAVVDTGTGAHVDRIIDALAALDIQSDELGAILLPHVHPISPHGHSQRHVIVNH